MIILSIETRKDDLQPKFAPDTLGGGLPSDPEYPEEYIETIITNLRKKYVNKVRPPMFEKDDGEPLSIQELQKLYRHVRKEGYGQ